MTEIPGTKTKHAIISDDCRTGRGEDGAFEEAVSRLRDEYKALCNGWPVGTKSLMHVVLTLERPQK